MKLATKIRRSLISKLAKSNAHFRRRESLKNQLGSRSLRFMGSLETLEPRLLLSFSPVLPIGSEIYQQELLGEFQSAIMPTAYSLVLEAGQRFSSRVIPADESLDISLEVLRPDGSSLAYIDSFGVNQAEYVNSLDITESGTYQIIVANLHGTGEYSLRFLLNSDFELESFTGMANGTLANAQSLDASLSELENGGRRGAIVGSFIDPADQADWFSFTLSKYQTANIHLTGQSSPNFDFEIFNSSGQLLGSGSPSTSGLESDKWLLHRAATDGVYYVAVSRTDTELVGEYSLLVLQNPVAVRALPGFMANVFPSNDDGTLGPISLGFTSPINYFGTNTAALFINNNGNVTFDSTLSTYTPFPLSNTNRKILAPFFADVDTRGGNPVRYGRDVIDGRNAFGVVWDRVGYFNATHNKTNYFEVVIIDREDTGLGNFDVEFNYVQIQWETGSASGGSNGLGGNSARVGFASGTNNPFREFIGSAINGAFLDNNLVTGLIHNSYKSDVPGRYVLNVREGAVVDPDLVLDSVLVAPSAPESGREVSVNWTLRNAGNEATPSSWSDRVRVVHNQTGAVVLDRAVVYDPLQPGNGAIQPGETRLRTTQFSLPDGFPGVGTFSVTVTADALNQIYEVSETNNSRSTTFTSTLAPYSELVVQNIVAPSTINVGEQITVQWRIDNIGDIEAAGTWTERIWLSSDATIGNDLFLTDVTYDGSIPPGGSAQRSATIQLPTSIIGDRYFVIETNVGNQPFELIRTNNIDISESLTAIVAPDLIVTNLELSTDTAVFGSPVSVSFLIENIGLGTAAGTWSNRIYFSTSSQFDSSATLVADFTTQGAPLGSNQTRQISRDITLPLSSSLFSGNYYFFVAADSQNQIIESNEVNNVAVTSPVNITLPPLPDLVVSNISFPPEAVSGRSIEYSWTITNQGTAPASGTWQDRVWLSTDGQVGDDQHIGDFNFTGTLAPGESITRTQSYAVPVTMEGNRWFVVQTDRNNHIFEHANDANNISVSTSSMNVILAPFPNLQVASVTPPNTAFSGQQAVVDWVVTNVGNGATSSPFWRDAVYVNTTASLTGATFLGHVNNPSYLGPNESYVNSLTVTLPQGISGPHFFIIVTDYQNNVFEYQNENDNTRASSAVDIQLTPPPDLQVPSVIAPANAFSGQPLTLSWTVINQGIGDTRQSSWSDRIYLSTDATVSGDDTVLATIGRSGALDSGESYSRSTTVTLPVGISGPFFFIVQADVFNQVFEHVFENNNNRATNSTTQVFLTPPPDLEIEQVLPPETARAGTALNVTYRVANNGSTVTPNSSWRDELWISADNVFSPQTDILIGARNRSGSLQPGDSYTAQLSGILPNGLNAPYFVFVRTDSNNVVFEVDTTNNLSSPAGPVAIESRPADLIVSTVSAPASATAGGTALVSWEVGNQGIGDTIVGSWSDRIVLSQDNVYGNSDDVVLANVPRSGVLNVESSYSVANRLVNIPFLLSSGAYYLFVATDSGNQVFESAENNNVSAARPISITRLLPDLQVDSVSAPLTANSGEPLEVSWTVTNYGESATNVTWWYDDVFLSTDTQIGTGDIFLGRVQRTNALGSLGSYTRTQSFPLSIDLTGDYHVLVRTDATNRVIEGSMEDNNDRATEQTTLVNLSPVPDLTVLSVQIPELAYSGHNFQVTWTVQNIGLGSTGDRSWHDTVYLSLDPIFDRTSDVSLGFRTRPHQLAPDAQYTRTETFTIPRGLTGPFFVFVATDSGEAVYERGATANNVNLAPQSLFVELLPPADLVVGTVTVPPDAVAGQNISITYTIHNQGTEAAVGSWTDSIFVSSDNQWDIGDPLLGRVNLIDRVIPPGGSYTRSLTAPLPGVIPGEYHIIIRTDIRNQIPESDLSNNIGASLDEVTIDFEQLDLSVPTSGMLIKDQSVYYRVDVPAGETLSVYLDSLATDGFNELYVSHGRVPTRSNHDFASIKPFEVDQRVVVPTTKEGTYYILAYGNSQPAGQSNYNLTAELVQFSVFDTNYGRGGTAGNRTILINGAKFDRTVLASLVDSDGLEFPAISYYRVSETELYATFDLTQVHPGHYDLSLLKPTTGESVSLFNSLEVIDGGGSNVSVFVSAPSATVRPRVGFPFVDTLHYNFTAGWNNGGLNDAPAPLLLLESNDEFGSSMLEIVNGNGTLSEYFVAAGAFGLPGVLATQDGGQKLLVTRNSGIAMGLNNADIFYTLTNVLRDENGPFDWEFFRDRLRPAIDARGDFDEAFNRVIASIGPLNRHVQEMIARNVNIVSSIQNNTTKFEDILRFEVLKSKASMHPSIRGIINASDFNVPLGGQVIYAINRSTDEIFSTTVFQDGSFFFVDLSLGDYEFYYPTAHLIFAEPQTVSDDDTPLDLVLQATASISVSGTVSTSGQSPLSNASILLVPLNAVDAIKPIAGVTGETGKFLISHVSPGSYRVLVSANGYQTAVIDQIFFDTSSSDELLISLDKVVNIIGTVRSALDGSPLSNAVLSVIDSISGDGIDVTYAEDDGSFVLSAPPGTYGITAERVGYSTGSIPSYVVSEDSAANPLVIFLQSAPNISGILVDISGTPVGGATIELLSDAVDEGLLLRTSTSQDGGYRFEHVAQGTYKIRAISGTTLLVETDLNVDGVSDVTANLSSEAVAKVQGIVRDREGNPVLDARITVYRNSKPILSAVAIENGNFELQFFESGSYVLVAESDTGVFPASMLEIQPDGSTFSIEFDAGTYQVSGAIKDQDGLTLENVPVFLVIDDEVNGYSREVRVTTDEFGRFIFDGLISGSYSVSAGPIGLLAATEVNVNVESENIDGVQLTLSRAASFTATVRESISGTPIANAMLFVYSVGTSDLRGIVGTDDDGVTENFALPIGVYDLVVVSEGRPAVTLPGFSLEQLDTDLIVSMGAVGTGKSVTGTVSSRIPELSQIAIIYANDDLGRVIGIAFVQDDGAYQLMGLPEQELIVMGMLEGSIGDSFAVDLRDSDSAIVDFTLSPVVSVSDSSLVNDEGRFFGMSAPAGWGDNWWRDARRDIPEMNLDISDEPACGDEDQIAYDRAVRAIENAKTARELALARQEILYWQSWSAPPAIIGATSTITGKILLGGLVIQGVKIPLGILGTIIGVDFARLFLSINDASTGLNTSNTDYIRVATGVDPAIARDSFLLGAQALETAQSARLAKEIEFAEGILKVQQQWMDPDVARGQRFNRSQKALIDRLNLRNSSAQALAMFAKVFAALDAFFSTKTEFERLALIGEEIGTQWANLIADVNRYYKAVEEAERLIAEYNNSKQAIGDQRKAVDDTSWSTRKNTSITISPRGVLSNDIGQKCGELIVGSWSAVTGGTLSNTSELGGFTFTPAQDFVGTARFSYSLAYRDTEGGVIFVDNAWVAIKVLNDDECQGDTCNTTNHVGSWDPNDIIGPNGFGEENWLPATSLLNYMIRYENDRELATAPAQVVAISQQLDSDLDFRTFRLGNISIGNYLITIPENRSFYSDRLDFRDSMNLFIDIVAGIDVVTGEAFWQLRSIDPETGDTPINPLNGFLPPNFDGTEGQGFVTYSIRPKANVPTGAVIDAEARIIFDLNEPIDTPPIFNTLDAGIPTSQVAALPELSEEPIFLVSWSGEDDENGSGLASYTIFVSTDNGPYTAWLTDTTLTEAWYVGEPGRRYAFYSVARDNAGNVEAAPLVPDTETLIEGGLATIGDRVWLDANANGIQDPDELGVPDILVRIYLEGSSTPLLETTTDSSGLYSFAELETDQSYFLEFIAPSGHAWTTANAGGNDALDSDVDLLTGRTAVFSVLTGINDQWDAGLVELGAVAGLTWLDINANGLRDASELILPGQTIFLDLNNNGQLDAGEPLSVTNSLGSFTFTDLRPAQYSVRMVAPKGWEITYPSSSGGGAGLHVVTLQSGQTRDDLNFGAKPIVVEQARVLDSFVQHAGYTGSGSPIDTGKLLAKEGSTPQTLTYANLINSARGINSLVFDLENLPRLLSASDFVFQMSPQGVFDQSANLPSSWQEAPTPTSVSVAAGFPSRVTIQWPDSAIVNRWLRISILANENTGLAESEVFYIGHLTGETAEAIYGVFTVSFADISALRPNVGSAADASSIYDVDKNGVISFADITHMRQFIGLQLPAITIPGASPLRLSSRIDDFRALAPLVDDLTVKPDRRQHLERYRTSQVDQLYGLLDEFETALEVDTVEVELFRFMFEPESGSRTPSERELTEAETEDEPFHIESLLLDATRRLSEKL